MRLRRRNRALVTARQRFKRAAKKLRDSERQLDEARVELRAAMAAARAEPRESRMTMDEMAKELGVTRQRVSAMLRELD